MATYRRREEIEAVQARSCGTLQTPDGIASYIPGDWIITLRNGDQFVCKQDVFCRKFILAEPPQGK
jgi:hypothetical protein